VTCRELTDFLNAYVADEMAAPERAQFEAHLFVCVACVAYLDSYRMTIAMGKRACEPAEGPTPDDVPEDLVRLILAARTKA
jgi:anti-sigma factor RsiW